MNNYLEGGKIPVIFTNIYRFFFLFTFVVVEVTVQSLRLYKASPCPWCMVWKATGKTCQSAVLSLRKLRGKVKITSLFDKITTLFVKITTLFDKITTLFNRILDTGYAGCTPSVPERLQRCIISISGLPTTKKI